MLSHVLQDSEYLSIGVTSEHTPVTDHSETRLMLLVAAVVLLLSGLFCLWVSFEYLARIDDHRAIAGAPAPPPQEEEPEEKGPRLTRLGRPIEEMRIRA